MLLEYAHSNGNEIIGITGHINSTIRKLFNFALNSSIESKACSLNLAPMCSTSVKIAL